MNDTQLPDAPPNISDLIANCAKEPIQIPGFIQDSGLLFLVDFATFELLQVSENVGDAFGIDVAMLLETHKNLATLLGLDDETVQLLKEQGGPALCDISKYNEKFKNIVAFVHPSALQELSTLTETHGSTIIIEAELLSDTGTMAYIQSMNQMLSRMNRFQLKLSKTRDMQTVRQLIAREIQAATSYDRVMLYEFDTDWHGHVVAEENATGVPITYLDVHFPASDIPPQARQLYTINKCRMISDVEYKKVGLYPLLNPRTNLPTDLTHSVFRSVSPIHVEYLRNMEVRASFSVSIVVNEKLWGLVACHHLKGPRFLSQTIRALCLSIGNISSAHIENLVNKKRQEEMEEARALLRQLETTFQKATWHNVRTVSAEFDTLLKIFHADYGLVSIMGETKVLGTMALRETPFVSALLDWVYTERPSVILTTDSILNRFPQFNIPQCQDCKTSGLIYIPLSLLSPCLLAFFRLEQISYVNWAGKEEDKIFFRQGEKSASLRPRNSFKVWTQEVTKKCKAWGDAAGELAKQTQGIMSKFVEMWRSEQFKSHTQQHDTLRKQHESDTSLAAETSKLKTRFMDTVSHEVRTPLNAIIGMLDLTSDTELDHTQRGYLTSAQFAADSLLRIVNDALDLSKVQSGTLAVAHDSFNLMELVNDTCAIFRPTIERKKLTFIVEQDPSIPAFVMGDALKVRQILSNLLANAQKYTDSGSIRVDHKLVSELGNKVTVELCISDTGIGIHAERQEAIFEPFEQEDNSLSRRYTGAGLGLSICKQLVTLMDGKIWVESTQKIGSTFHFSLPLQIGKAPPSFSPSGNQPPPLNPAPTLNFLLSSSSDLIPPPFNLNESTTLQQEAPTQEAPTPGSPNFLTPSLTRKRPLRVLVAEDNELNQKVLLNILRRLGHQSIVAWNGEEAVAAFFAAEPPIDLVLMDLFMPIMDGITATLLIRARESLRTPIVAVTAQALAGDKEACLKAGMDAYVTKPVKLSILQETIQNVTTFGITDLST